jgi:plasmid stability protein
MAEILIRDLDASVVEKLKARAAANGRSLQAELKAIPEAQARQVTKAEARAGCRHPAAHRYAPSNR